MAELIAAIATGTGPGGVGIVRLSGDGAIETLSKVFKPLGKSMLSEVPDRTMLYGTVRDKSGKMIDTALAFGSRAPHSYTGEETAELQCHGSPMVLSMALEALFSVGARQALPGEFTKRAFLNGRLDLVQAEAVIDLIDAETPAAAREAAQHLDGSLSRQSEEIYKGLVDVMAHFYAVLDYPDEDIDPFRAQTIRDALDRARTECRKLLATRERGRQLNRGLPTAIVGRPNAGKSSLLNALAGYERAIVTQIPGTTRDTIDVRVSVGGVLLNLIDTAGLRETADEAESLGVERSRKAAEEAELILLVLDSSQKLGQEDEEAILLAQKAPQSVCILNKSDLPGQIEESELRKQFPFLCHCSAATGHGIDELEKLVSEMFPTGHAMQYGSLLTNDRQADAVQRALDGVNRAYDGLEAELPPDLLLTDVEAALQALGELTGRTVREDITARIFERFCVGK